MKKEKKENRFFGQAHLVVLLEHTFFAVITITAAFTQSWEELWAFVPILIGVALCWGLHIQGKVPEKGRIWICTSITMLTFFFYGIHSESLVDLSIIMSSFIAISAVTAMKGVVYTEVFTYVVTVGYSIYINLQRSGFVSGENISRILLHVSLIVIIAAIGCAVINKWKKILDETTGEIEELQELTARLDDFLANASHEMRTPINAVIGLSEVCLDREEKEATRKDLVSIQDAGRRVADQMSDILNFTELDRDVLTVTPENYMISSLLSEAVNEIKPFITPKIELVLDVDPAIPAVMNSDVYKLKRIIRHLILNGLKYTEEGGVYVRITAQETRYGVNLCIDVHDTGIGISEENLEKIFYGFYQLDSSRTREHGGLGLGLFIVKGFVVALNGFMTVESEVDKGTKVHVCIPQKVVDSSSCMVVKNKKNVSLGAFFAFGKYPVPEVREYYNSMITNVVKGMGVALHGVDSMQNLKKVIDTTSISHVFIGMKEYETDIAYIEELAKKIPVYLTADRGYRIPENSKVRFFEKPLYCFPIISAINSSQDEYEGKRRMYCYGVRVLVVDDEPLNLVVAKGIFTKYGIHTETASSGKEALEKCRHERFDIIFMDHMMPGMDGVEAMKKIREDFAGRNGDTPVIALTANTVSTAREMFAREGFNGFVGKPIEAYVLERVLKDILPASVIAYEIPKDKDEKKGWKKYDRTDINSGKSVESIISDLKKNDENASEVDDSGQDSDLWREANEASKSETVEKTEDTKETDTKSGFSGKSFARLLRNGINTEKGLEYCQGDEELYAEILNDFVEDSANTIKVLDEAMKKEDLEMYEIKIHALKGTSKMIGATELSDTALELETYAKERKIEEVRERHSAMTEKMALVTGTIRSVLK